MKHSMIVFLFLAIAAAVSVFDFDMLPACARSCEMLAISELICVPPAAPVTNQATYKDCVCQSEYLRSLHKNGNICRSVCADEDDARISTYYNVICTTGDMVLTTTRAMSTSPASAAATTTSTSALSTLSISGTYTSSLSATPTGPIDTQERKEEKQDWLHQNWRYIVVACSVLFGMLFGLLLGLACYYRRRRRGRTLQYRPRAARRRNIPLETIPRRKASSRFPVRFQTADSAPGIMPPKRPYVPGDSLRKYCLTREEAAARPLVPSPSLDQIESRIMQRIRTTGLD